MSIKSFYKAAITSILSLAFLAGIGMGHSAMAEAQKKKIGIIIFDGVLTSDVTAPAEVLGAATEQNWFTGYEVVMIGVDKKVIKTAEGLTLTATATVADNLKLEAIIIPSAYNMMPLIKNAALVKYVKEQAQGASWVNSNCSGAFLLAATGLLDGRKATTWAGGEKDLKKQFPKVDVKFNTNVVIDDKFISSNGSVVSYEAALILLSKLSSPAQAKKIAEVIQYSRFNAALKL